MLEWIAGALILESIDWECIDWGTAGEWAGAIGTTAAVGAAVRLARMEANRDEERVAERRRAEADRVRTQAERVHGWVSGPWHLHGDTPHQTVRLSNTSNQPVYDLSIDLRYTPEHHEIHGLGVLAPNADLARDVRLSSSPTPNVTPDLALVFRDRAGRLWQRTGGELMLLIGRRGDRDIHRLLDENPAT